MPEIVPPVVPMPPPAQPPHVEPPAQGAKAWKKSKNTPAGIHAAAVVFAGWGPHDRLTEAAYDAAVSAVASQEIR